MIENLNQLLSNTALLDSDRQHIETTLDMIKLMNEKYVEKLDKCKRENEKINTFNTYIRSYKAKYIRKITDEQAVFSDYIEEKEIAIEDMAELLIKNAV